MKKHLLIYCLLSCTSLLAVDWSRDARVVPGENRADIYDLGANLEEAKERGFIHALKWPVSVTGLLVPYEPLKYFLSDSQDSSFHRFIASIGQKQLKFSTMDEMYDWLGLNIYPDNFQVPSVFQVPYPGGTYPDYRMGASIIKPPYHDEAQGITFSCATCHSGTFMGRTVMGLTNKRPRANEFFVMAKKYVPLIPAGLFRLGTKANEEEKSMYARTRRNLQYVEAIAPLVLGLDTSLPHVALSLNVRAKDAYATKKRPRRVKRHPLQDKRGDSKPMPWWNLKYKTRWLSDGSIVQGNPVLTNFLWNELGRGTNLHQLEKWMRDSEETIQDLTAAVFAVEPPHWTDFFPAESINIERARRGEKVFNQSCQKCHGVYEKNWSLPGSEEAPLAWQLKNTRVVYHEKTPVKDVGTDPYRYQATKYFAKDLNRLQISKWMKTVVEPQVGYVPPPLVGIFLRYPYFHNNAIPNLCALMAHPSKRPEVFVQGPSQELQDYDQDCVGYPTGDKIPMQWWEDTEAKYVANSQPGLSNQGHTQAFWTEAGQPKMSEEEKRNLREYLKTL